MFDNRVDGAGVKLIIEGPLKIDLIFYRLYYSLEYRPPPWMIQNLYFNTS